MTGESNPLRSNWMIINQRWNECAALVVLSRQCPGITCGRPRQETKQASSWPGSSMQWACIVAAIVFCSLCLGATAATVTIQPGDNVQAVVNANLPATTYQFASGIFRLQSIIPKSGDTFIGEPGAILSGATVLGGWEQSGRFWCAEAREARPQSPATNDCTICLKDHPRCCDPHDLFVDNVPLKQVDAQDAVTPGTWFFDAPAGRIYIGENPTGKSVELSVTEIAFSGGASNVTLRKLVVEKYATPTITQSAAIQIGNGWIIEDCEVRWNHFAGIDTLSNSIARRNRVHHNGCMGFRGAGENILIEGNEISHNNYAGFDSFWGGGGSKWVFTTHLIVRGNYSHHNQGPGLWTDINNIHTLYESNIVEANLRGGIFHEISYDATIRNNVARRNGAGRHFPYWATGAGIEIVSSRNVEVYGNCLEENWQGITALNDHRGSGIHGVWALTGLNVHDNTVIYLTDQGRGSGRSGLTDTQGAAGPALQLAATNRFARNTYYLPPAGTNFFAGSELTDTQWTALGHDTPGGAIHRGVNPSVSR